MEPRFYVITEEQRPLRRGRARAMLGLLYMSGNLVLVSTLCHVDVLGVGLWTPFTLAIAIAYLMTAMFAKLATTQDLLYHMERSLHLCVPLFLIALRMEEGLEWYSLAGG